MLKNLKLTVKGITHRLIRKTEEKCRLIILQKGIMAYQTGNFIERTKTLHGICIKKEGTDKKTNTERFVSVFLRVLRASVVKK